MVFNPQGLATATGSMPHTEPSDTCDIVLNVIAGIPIWPRFPETVFREEMETQDSEGIPTTPWGYLEGIFGSLPSTKGKLSTHDSCTEMTRRGIKLTIWDTMVEEEVRMPEFSCKGKKSAANKKFIHAEGGAQRVVWMNRAPKEGMAPGSKEIGQKDSVEDFLDRVAGENFFVTQEEGLEFIGKTEDPALAVSPLL